MFVKELRNIWWKVLAGVGIVFLNIVLFLQTRSYADEYMIFYGEGGADEFVLMNLLDTMFTGLGMSLALVAVLIGAGAFRQESDDDTILTLLSKPLSRRRIFLTKYGVGAAGLLVTALIGALMFWGSGFVLGYPMQDFEYLFSVRFAGTLWLASLAVLGISTLVSIVVRGVFVCLTVSAVLAATLLFFGPLVVAATEFFYTVTGIEIVPGVGTFGSESALLDFLWTRFYLAAYIAPEYSGTEIPLPNVWVLSPSVVALAVVIPLLAALWVFERKEY